MALVQSTERRSPKALVVLLVETSPDMLPRWQDVRQHYFPLLLDALQGGLDIGENATSIAIIPIADVMVENDRTSVAAFGTFGSRQTQLNNLRLLEFRSIPTEDAYWKAFERGVNLLSSSRIEPDCKHIISVLTSLPEVSKPRPRASPYPDSHTRNAANRTTRASTTFATSPLVPTPWERFMPMLLEHDINISFILQPKRRSTSLDTFFKHTLDKQKRTPNPTWFDYNARKYQFFLSGFSRGPSGKEQRREAQLTRRRSASPPSAQTRARAAGSSAGLTMDALNTNAASATTPASSTSSDSHSPGASSVASSTSTSSKGKERRKPGLVNDLRVRFGFKPSTEDPPDLFAAVKTEEEERGLTTPTQLTIPSSAMYTTAVEVNSSGAGAASVNGLGPMVGSTAIGGDELLEGYQTLGRHSAAAGSGASLFRRPDSRINGTLSSNMYDRSSSVLNYPTSPLPPMGNSSTATSLASLNPAQASGYHPLPQLQPLHAPSPPFRSPLVSPGPGANASLSSSNTMLATFPSSSHASVMQHPPQRGSAEYLAEHPPAGPFSFLHTHLGAQGSVSSTTFDSPVHHSGTAIYDAYVQPSRPHYALGLTEVNHGHDYHMVSPTASESSMVRVSGASSLYGWNGQC